MTYPITQRLDGLVNHTVVHAHEIVVCLKRGTYAGTLEAGSHWLWGAQTLVRYNRTAPVPDLTVLPHEVLLEQPELGRELYTFLVPNGRLALEYRHGLVERVLGPGRYLYWERDAAVEHRLLDPMGAGPPADLVWDAQLRQLLRAYVSVSVVQEYEGALLYRNGRLVGPLPAGEHLLWNVPGNAVAVRKTDLRARLIEIKGQEILTLDKAVVRLNAMATYRVVDAERFLTQAADAERQLYVAVQLAAREFVGTKMLDQLLSRDTGFTDYLRAALTETEAMLGLRVLEIGLRDVILPGEMRDILHRVLVAEKTVQANVVLRRDETAATRAMLNTAKLMDDHPMLLRLKEMEYVEKIADNVSTITLNGRGEMLTQLRTLLAPGGATDANEAT